MPTIDEVLQSSENPLVSVVMPHWQALPYIGETIRSVSNQTFLNHGGSLELIIIDDGSSIQDYSRLCEIFQLSKNELAARSISSVLYTVPHGGKNRALEAAKNYINRRSRYAFVADSDDVFAPQFVEVLYDRLEQQRASDMRTVMAYCDSILIDEREFCIGTATAPDFDRDLYFGRDGVEGKNFIPGNALVVTKTFRESIPEDLDTADRDKWWRHTAELGQNGKAHHVAERHYFYRQRDGQMSGHGQQLKEKEFFSHWPQGVAKPHWGQWLDLRPEARLVLLQKMPSTGNGAWDHYQPNNSR